MKNIALHGFLDFLIFNYIYSMCPSYRHELRFQSIGCLVTDFTKLLTTACIQGLRIIGIFF